MPMRFGGSVVKNVSYGSTNVSAVWKGTSLVYPSGLVRNNLACSEYWVRDNCVQFSLSQPGAQLGSTSQIIAGWCPAFFQGLRGFYCNVTGSYRYRYRARLNVLNSPGITAEVRIVRLNLNANIGAYDTSTIVASHSLQTMLYGQEYPIDVGDGYSVYLQAGNWYAFVYSENCGGWFSESYALSSVCANF